MGNFILRKKEKWAKAAFLELNFHSFSRLTRDRECVFVDTVLQSSHDEAQVKTENE